MIFIAGCSPPGPRALLKGKKFLERGDYSSAVEHLKTATSLLPANAQAWNYYGVALQHAGQPDDAANAYNRALTLDRDLTEAHYNLGCLWLEQNKLADAKTEFTAYTLRRSNAPEGWLKLGDAQLRAGETASAESSFSTAYHLDGNSVEALNGFGLARIARGRPREAAQFFAAAIQHHSDFAPAILNLATVNAEYFHDNKTALENYRAYLALTPRPADWDDVNNLANNLEQSPAAAVAVANPPQENQNETAPLSPLVVSETKTQATVAIHPFAPPKMQQTTHKPQQAAKVQPPQEIVATTEPQKAQSPGALHSLNPFHWFNSSTQANYSQNGVTPLPSEKPISTAVSNPPAAQKIVPPPPPVFPRYAYLSPRKPKSGDRVAASGAFTKARASEQDSHLADAAQSYQKAAQLDPAWFEAQYNYSVLAYRLKNFRQSLAACEMALAIQPDSADARYNFALALKASGYMTDAVNELKKIVAANPSEARAHLALGDIYAQYLRDTADARLHYLKFLDLEPRNPQATNVRFWLASNPQ
ncbi:MAG TPA: tetratricopeptide repeat protein [Verrucomicrobiae bacterium]|nr:tetratricopeptide repeat protein [Verrucomicrobiae bacterium]